MIDPPTSSSHPPAAFHTDTKAAAFVGLGVDKFRVWSIRHGLRPAFKEVAQSRFTYLTSDLLRCLREDAEKTKRGLPLT